VVLLNSGATLALITQAQQLLSLFSRTTIGVSILLWIAGIICGSAAWIAGFSSTRHVDRTERGKPEDMKSADSLMHVGVCLVVLSLSLFSVGSALLAISLIAGAD